MVRSQQNFVDLVLEKFLVMVALFPHAGLVQEFLSQEELGSKGCPRPVCALCGLGSAGLMAGIDDLKGIFYPE